jgi:hypothetical protein
MQVEISSRRCAPGRASFLFVIAGLAGIVACQGSDRSKDATTPVSPADGARLNAAVHQELARGQRVSAEEFVNKNPMGWVGRTHNRFLDEMFRELQRTPFSDPCRVVERVLLNGRFVGEDSVHLSHADRSRLVGKAMQATRCGARLASNGATPERVFAPSLARFTPLRKTTVDGYFAAISSAFDAAANASSLASSLSSITSAAAQELSGDDLDAVNAAASVAVSSMDYWDSNLNSQLSAFQATYGACISVAQTLNECLQVRYDRPLSSERAQLVPVAYHGAARVCSISGRDIARVDLGTAGATLVSRSWQLIVLSSAGASAADGLFQFGLYLWCALR